METILITGGAGSLGRAFIRLLHGKYNLTVIDNNEWGIAELKNEYPDTTCLLMDFGDWRFDQYPCDYLIHLAAYKHVNIGEELPESFIENNINKTAKLFKEAYQFDVDTLFVSTDKAVEPISLYGYTKAIGECLAKHYNFSIARLGNILNSSGSVIPVWEQAIYKGEPIKITDERMVRYFIEDFNAVDQIWDQFKSDKKLIIPQCKEMRLLDLMAETLRRHNIDPNTYKVQVVGMRPGEKLREKLNWDSETISKEEE